MKKSFTIIEVIISVVILALVGVALLKSGALNLTLLEKVGKKEAFSDYITIIANHRNVDFNHLSKALEDFLPQFKPEDDELRKIFKEKFSYREKIVKVKLPALEGFDEESEEEPAAQNPIDINFIKLSIKNDESGDYIYILELNE